MAHERIAWVYEDNPEPTIIRGTEIPSIIGLLRTGASVAEALAAHPGLTREDIEVAEAFAAEYLADISDLERMLEPYYEPFESPEAEALKAAAIAEAQASIPASRFVSHDIVHDWLKDLAADDTGCRRTHASRGSVPKPC
jgi:hypothetical protein